jgi:cytochrome c-type biogenesis protein CcmF
MFLVPVLPLCALLGLGMHSAWRTMSAETLLHRLKWPAVAAVAAGVILPFVFFRAASVLAIVSITIGIWVCVSSMLDPARKLLLRTGAPLTRGHFGMCLAHFGVGVFILGATVASAYNLEVDVSAKPGDTVKAGSYELVFRSMKRVQGPNFVADEGEFELRRGGKLVTMLAPQKRVYRVQQNPMTEAAINTNPARDVFLALGDPLGDNAWSLRIQVKPMISFLWFGSGIMALGGILAITDRRYRQLRQKQAVRVEAVGAA